MTFTHIQTIEHHHNHTIDKGVLHLITPIQDDCPRDAWHCWSLYHSTYKKLRKTSLPLLETMQLKGMLQQLKDYKPKKTQSIQYPPPLHYKTSSSGAIPLPFVKSLPSTHSHCYRPIQYFFWTL
ncbi:hypothetical protein K501DRAFT_330151 [Backusella circina FSU 941]|nr:hypothetical protein K501DRAFT_330151 [Backusella circina FSU 941]